MADLSRTDVAIPDAPGEDVLRYMHVMMHLSEHMYLGAENEQSAKAGGPKAYYGFWHTDDEHSDDGLPPVAWAGPFAERTDAINAARSGLMACAERLGVPVPPEERERIIKEEDIVDPEPGDPIGRLIAMLDAASESDEDE